MTGSSDDLYELHDEIDSQVQSFERAAAASAGPAEATDESRSIEVRAAADGGIEQLTIRDTWREHYPPAGLGAAVLATYASAGAERARGWSTTLAEDLDDDSARPRPTPFAHETVVGQLQEIMDAQPDRAVDVETSLNALVGILHEMNQGLDQTVRIVRERAAAEHPGRSSSGKVVATVNGAGVLTGLEYDEQWLENRHAYNITRETTEAVEAARRTAAMATPSDPIDGTPLADVIRTTQDPRALAERMRFTG
ncbi:hypothetical protein Bcav_3830 [Beutenbergia cavernae DSM 12333]|uniref:YbaB/EbfC DNA-binding family protein n=1 Tax=Beutenbergia cavernae (strain ATCC BAA-8 / DSM 12333 / CCUG 43141 / JCM 11478 / NBRC 16432 / NCIMB 13614 / HKI 0122) TaxID=471853 RepID=C5C4E8_BEUC1|nr:hypothetical protein [Beutenbergia cavernae]ACQ82072.1 hypothetical protein Bcav_3830 [Beutenbergia cavernae DSM 12333]